MRASNSQEYAQFFDQGQDKEYTCVVILAENAGIAQLDRAFGFEPKGRGFESLCSHQNTISLSGGRFLFCYTIRNMSMLLLAGIVLTGFPLLLIVGFAGYIFLGFINDDKDARAIFNVAMIIMGIGIALILAYFLTKVIIVTP